MNVKFEACTDVLTYICTFIHYLPYKVCNKDFVLLGSIGRENYPCLVVGYIWNHTIFLEHCAEKEPWYRERRKQRERRKHIFTQYSLA